MEFLKQLKFKNKKAAAFGCYGWSGESVKIPQEMLGKAGFTDDKNLLQVHFAHLSCDTSFAVLNMEMQLQNQVGRVALNTLRLTPKKSAFAQETPEAQAAGETTNGSTLFGVNPLLSRY